MKKVSLSFNIKKLLIDPNGEYLTHDIFPLYYMKNSSKLKEYSEYYHNLAKRAHAYIEVALYGLMVDAKERNLSIYSCIPSHTIIDNDIMISEFDWYESDDSKSEVHLKDNIAYVECMTKIYSINITKYYNEIKQ